MSEETNTDQEDHTEEELGKTDRQAIELSLKDCFRKPSIGLLSRLLGESTEYDYEFKFVGFHRAAELFPRVKLVWITLQAPVLSIPILPSGGSRGLFAIIDGLASPLASSNPASFESLLRSDPEFATRIAESNSPRLFAELILDSLFSTRERQFHFIESFSDLESFRAPQGFASYQLAPKALELKEGPSLARYYESVGDKGGFRISFCALSGWKHELQDLSRIDAEYIPGMPLTHTIEAIVSPVFSQIPLIRY